MARIDQITIKRNLSPNGREFDQVRLWIAGIPFSADLPEGAEITERIIRRIAAAEGLEVLDHRRSRSSGGEAALAEEEAQ